MSEVSRELSKRIHSLDEFHAKAFLADLTLITAEEGQVDQRRFRELLKLREKGQELAEVRSGDRIEILIGGAK